MITLEASGKVTEVRAVEGERNFFGERMSETYIVEVTCPDFGQLRFQSDTPWTVGSLARVYVEPVSGNESGS